MKLSGGDRRHFIKGLGKLVLGGALFASSPVLATSVAEPQKPEKPLAGRVAIITGGARGIGLATARKLADMGAHIGLIDIANPKAIRGLGYDLATPESLEAAKTELVAKGVKCSTVIADVRDHEAMKSAIQSLARDLGGLDIVVANAAIAANTSADGPIDHAIAQDIVNVNIIGVMNTINPAIPFLKQSSHQGRIVAISSMAGRMGLPSLSVYCASKWAVIGMVKSLCLDLGQHKITVNAVAPTGVKTTMMLGSLGIGIIDDISEMQLDNSLRGFHSLPVGLLEPEAIADAVAYLVSDTTKDVSGIVLDVSAGLSGRNLG